MVTAIKTVLENKPELYAITEVLFVLNQNSCQQSNVKLNLNSCNRVKDVIIPQKKMNHQDSS
jgi:hypothetical protein